MVFTRDDVSRGKREERGGERDEVLTSNPQTARIGTAGRARAGKTPGDWAEKETKGGVRPGDVRDAETCQDGRPGVVRDWACRTEKWLTRTDARPGAILTFCGRRTGRVDRILWCPGW